MQTVERLSSRPSFYISHTRILLGKGRKRNAWLLIRSPSLCHYRPRSRSHHEDTRFATNRLLASFLRRESPALSKHRAWSIARSSTAVSRTNDQRRKHPFCGRLRGCRSTPIRMAASSQRYCPRDKSSEPRAFAKIKDFASRFRRSNHRSFATYAHFVAPD